MCDVDVMGRFVLCLIVGTSATFGCAGREPAVVSPSAAKTSATVVSPSVVPSGLHHLSATAGPMVLAADGAHAALTMRRPLAGMYRTALFDLAAGTFQGLGRSAVSELYPEAAGTWLAATQVPGKGGRQREAKVCLLRIVPQTHAETVLACFPTREVSSTISSISPDGHFVVLKVRELSPDEGVAVVDTTSGATVAEVPGHQIYLHVDDTGRVVWDESADGKKSEVHLGAGHEVVVLPGGEGVAVGFTLDHQVIVGKPSAEIAAFDGPLKTLRDVARCGHLRTLPTPGSGMVHE
jgi:hypothetical protein